MIVLNRWKHHEDTVENFYADSYSWFHTGDAHGWQIANGLYGAAEGPYPNLSSPVWQKVLNQGART
jgi:acyl-CoA synthetase (AMP-forming)/AMP-acid ligase II